MNFKNNAQRKAVHANKNKGFGKWLWQNEFSNIEKKKALNVYYYPKDVKELSTKNWNELPNKVQTNFANLHNYTKAEDRNFDKALKIKKENNNIRKAMRKL